MRNVVYVICLGIFCSLQLSADEVSSKSSEHNDISEIDISELRREMEGKLNISPSRPIVLSKTGAHDIIPRVGNLQITARKGEVSENDSDWLEIQKFLKSDKGEAEKVSIIRMLPLTQRTVDTVLNSLQTISESQIVASSLGPISRNALDKTAKKKVSDFVAEFLSQNIGDYGKSISAVNSLIYLKGQESAPVLTGIIINSNSAAYPTIKMLLRYLQTHQNSIHQAIIHSVVERGELSEDIIKSLFKHSDN